MKAFLGAAIAATLFSVVVLMATPGGVGALALTHPLSQGMQSDDVQVLQQYLKDHGYLVGWQATGLYGPATRDAVAQFQTDNGLEPVGSVGPKTLALLNGGASAASTPPVISINGENPAHIKVGDSYVDLGATITAPEQDKNLGIKTYLNGALVSDIVLDTSTTTTDTIGYVATDGAGLTSTSTRTVIIEPAAPSTPLSLPITSSTPLVPTTDSATSTTAPRTATTTEL